VQRLRLAAAVAGLCRLVVDTSLELGFERGCEKPVKLAVDRVDNEAARAGRSSPSARHAPCG
jgi:hypothetical protein